MDCTEFYHCSNDIVNNNDNDIFIFFTERCKKYEKENKDWNDDHPDLKNKREYFDEWKENDRKDKKFFFQILTNIFL